MKTFLYFCLYMDTKMGTRPLNTTKVTFAKFLVCGRNAASTSYVPILQVTCQIKTARVFVNNL
jgi:hypothetical protein